jgi:hypothetical protein
MTTDNSAPANDLVERLLDNLAMGSQDRRFLDDYNGDDPLRELVVLNVINPLLAEIERLRGGLSECELERGTLGGLVIYLLSRVATARAEGFAECQRMALAAIDAMVIEVVGNSAATEEQCLRVISALVRPQEKV